MKYLKMILDSTYFLKLFKKKRLQSKPDTIYIYIYIYIKTIKKKKQFHTIHESVIRNDKT